MQDPLASSALLAHACDASSRKRTACGRSPLPYAKETENVGLDGEGSVRGKRQIWKKQVQFALRRGGGVRAVHDVRVDHQAVVSPDRTGRGLDGVRRPHEGARDQMGLRRLER